MKQSSILGNLWLAFLVGACLTAVFYGLLQVAANWETNLVRDRQLHIGEREREK